MTKPCPNCGIDAELSSANLHRPFCSERCRLIDLGDWLTEKNYFPDNDIPANTPDDDLSSTH